MASIATLKINSYIFITLLILVFAIFMSAIVFVLNIPFYFFIVLTILIVIFQIAISSTIVRWTTGTKMLKPGENKYLEDKVKKLTQQADIPMPKLGIVRDPTPNAFVFGITQSGSTLVVHEGLLQQLNDKEIEAVLAHEIGHIRNRDCMYMTFLSVIPLIAYMGMRMLFYARYGRSKGNSAAVILAIGLISIVIWFLSSLLIKRLSRIREYFADAYSGYITNDPQSLASALTKITYGLSLAPEKDKSRSAARSFYIGDVQNAHKEMKQISKNISKYDLDGDGVIDDKELELAMEEEAGRSNWNRFSGLFSTHPPTFKRILALKEMQKDLEDGRVDSDHIYEKVDF